MNSYENLEEAPDGVYWLHKPGAADEYIICLKFFDPSYGDYIISFIGHSRHVMELPADCCLIGPVQPPKPEFGHLPCAKEEAPVKGPKRCRQVGHMFYPDSIGFCQHCGGARPIRVGA